MPDSDAVKPWWREPWPWILMAGPAMAIVGCAVTIVLAFDSFGDQAVVDGGVKQGLRVSRPAPAAGESARPSEQTGSPTGSAAGQTPAQL